MAQIIDRGGGRQLVRIYLGRDATGRRRFYNKTITGSDRDAQKFARKKERERDAGELDTPSAQTYSEHLDEWLALKKTEVRERSFYYYETVAANLKRMIGGLKLKEIRPSHVRNLLADLQRMGRSPQTLRQTHHMIKSSLREAVLSEKIKTNPADAVKPPPLGHTEKPALSLEESKRFREACPKSKHGTMFLFALSTGMRPEEFLGLGWDDLDLEKGKATVRRVVYYRKGGGWAYGEPKSKRSRRTLPVPASLCLLLREHRRRQLEHKMRAGSYYHDHGLVFPTSTGQPFRSEHVSGRYFKPLLVIAKLPSHLTLYVLRHTYCTLQLAAGVKINTVSQRMGHSSPSFTLSVYGHSIQEMEDEADRMVERIFG